ncbi:MAG TPA: MFS transporter [Candidatus Limnocylindrales bacterium]|nr:MFS transporter [Candidatus Limnocylindrales bacterium]
MATAAAPASSRTGLRLIERLAGLTPSGRAGVPVAWALYDFANTIYSYAIVSFAMGLWVVEDTRLGAADGQFWFGVANAASVGLNALVSPVLGAMSDRGGRRMPYLLFFTALTIVATATIGLIASGTGTTLTFVGLALFTLANFSYQAALIYYDATLPLVSKPTTRGRISGIGVAVGYLGTIVIALLILVTDSGSGGLTFLMAAVLFALFSVPIFLFVKEPAGSAYRFRVSDAVASWGQLRTTVAHAREVPGLMRFLVGRFFYTDPVNTVIVVMSVFATQAIGLTKTQANLVLLGLTVAAVLASFGWGVVVERYGPKRTLMWVLASWCVGLLIAGSVLSLPTFLIAGVLLGSGLGGVWTSDRVYMLRLSPPDRIGEFFGLYGLAGKFSAVTGPILYGTIVSVLLNAGWGNVAYQAGILSFLVLMVIGILLLRGVPDRPSEPEPGHVHHLSAPDKLIPAFDTRDADPS